ncbi:hypothetical protein FGO68_gene6045 [Halteria grandinella]|uniref:Uncharacterized protein n=1 Tax=Halteria grandinella TaxID=5974 RepID=A0A8J8T1L7_HALGN|nr:hypothetical protein FGO68_gene6045 [Halteria grandinella]
MLQPLKRKNFLSETFKIIRNQARISIRKVIHKVVHKTILDVKVTDWSDTTSNDSIHLRSFRKQQLEKRLNREINAEQEDKKAIQNHDETKSLILKLCACLLYAASSSGLTFVNKSIYVRFGFQSPLDVSIT